MIEIMDDDQYEPDEQFYLKLSLTHNLSYKYKEVTLGRISIMEVTILNDDGMYLMNCFFCFVFLNNSQIINLICMYLNAEPGTITFEERGILVKESVGVAQIPVLRKNGSDGEVSIRWRTIGSL